MEWYLRVGAPSGRGHSLLLTWGLLAEPRCAPGNDRAPSGRRGACIDAKMRAPSILVWGAGWTLGLGFYCRFMRGISPAGAALCLCRGRIKE